jgi:type VI secretion system protein ImpJ
MTKRTRLVWNEGLLLTPQHLQHLDRYHEETAVELFRSARPFGWGLTFLELDREAIHNGQVVVHSASGVLPLGGAFSIPDRDEAPPGLNIEDRFPLSESRLPLYLGLRIHRPGEREVAGATDGDQAETRYREATLRAMDETSGENEREIVVSHRNFRLLLPGETLGNYDHLPLAEVVRKPEGGFAYREDHVPPCLSIGASDAVLRTLRRLLEILVAKSRELSERRRHSGKGVAEFGRDDVAGFWLLGVVNAAIPEISHYLRGAVAHPERVYTSLARLAGTLTTMSDQDVRDIAVYEHERPEAAFADLGARIPKLMETVLPRHYTRIALEKGANDVFAGRLEDDRLLAPKVGFYLGVYASMPTGEIQTSLPQKIKIATPDRIEFLISNALTGVSVRHVQTAPASLPVQAGYVYFQVEKSGDVWDLVAGSHAIALYAPPEFPNIQLELIALND